MMEPSSSRVRNNLGKDCFIEGSKTIILRDINKIEKESFNALVKLVLLTTRFVKYITGISANITDLVCDKIIKITIINK